MENNLKELAVAAVKRAPVAEFSRTDVEHALREELKKIAGTPAQFEKNKWEVFALIQSAADEVIPVRVEQIMGQFAEVQQVGQGNKATFKRRLGKRRGKTFVTKVSPAGTYESFRLDSEIVEIPTEAVGASAIVDWERYLDGMDDMADLVDIIMEGIEDAIYRAVYAQLIAAYTNTKMPDANKVTAAGFDKPSMDRLLAVINSYGGSSVIFCSQLFAANIDNEIKGHLNDTDKMEVRNQGYVGVYHGAPVVTLPLATATEANLKWAFDPSFAFVMPAGQEKVVKVVLEGELQMNSWVNPDWSIEIQFYKKHGVGMLHLNNWGIYKDTSLSEDVIPATQSM